MLLAGSVRVNGQAAGKAGTATATDAAIEIVGDGLKYVGRGGLKLEGALEDFGVSPAGKVCLDAGSSKRADSRIACYRMARSGCSRWT